MSRATHFFWTRAQMDGQSQTGGDEEEGSGEGAARRRMQRNGFLDEAQEGALSPRMIDGTEKTRGCKQRRRQKQQQRQQQQHKHKQRTTGGRCGGRRTTADRRACRWTNYPSQRCADGGWLLVLLEPCSLLAHVSDAPESESYRQGCLLRLAS